MHNKSTQTVSEWIQLKKPRRTYGTALTTIKTSINILHKEVIRCWSDEYGTKSEMLENVRINKFSWQMQQEIHSNCESFVFILLES